MMRLQNEVAQWNAQHPVGTEVFLTKDDGEVLHTKTRSTAWVLGGHTNLILLENISGACDLDRVKLVQMSLSP
jgi:hypothetical protein